MTITKTLSIILAATLIPLSLTGCSNDEKTSKEKTIESFIEIAKINAAREGNEISLDYIMNTINDSSNHYETLQQKEIPNFEQFPDHIEATYEDGTSCGIVVKAKLVIVTC